MDPKALRPHRAFGGSRRRSGTAASFSCLWAGPVDLTISLTLSSRPSLRGHPMLSDEPSQELFWVSWANRHPPEISEHCNFCVPDPDEQPPAEDDHLPQRKSGQKKRWRCALGCPTGCQCLSCEDIPRLSRKLLAAFSFGKKYHSSSKTDNKM